MNSLNTHSYENTHKLAMMKATHEQHNSSLKIDGIYLPN